MKPVISHTSPDRKVHGAHMWPICGRQDLGGPHVGPMNLALWVSKKYVCYKSSHTSTWVPPQYKLGLSRYDVSIIKIRRSYDRLIFIIGIPILIRQHLYIETCPWYTSYLLQSCRLRQEMAEHGPEEIFLPETWSPNPDEILYVHETEGCSLTEVNINNKVKHTIDMIV